MKKRVGGGCSFFFFFFPRYFFSSSTSTCPCSCSSLRCLLFTALLICCLICCPSMAVAKPASHIKLPGITNATIREMMSNTSNLLTSVFSSYDLLRRPQVEEPLSVTVSIYVYSIGPISEKEMVYTIDCYFRQYWQDERLEFNARLDQLSLSAGIVNSIWRPDTYFWNSKSAYLHKITQPNRFLRIKRDGTISYSQRLTIVAGCSMFLRTYPLDVQRCKLTIGSCKFNFFNFFCEFWNFNFLSSCLPCLWY